jgi:hypothetical protein
MKVVVSVGARILGAVLIAMCSLAFSTAARTHSWSSARTQVTVNPTLIDFGTIAVGTSSSSTSVTLTNSGRHDVVINASISPAQFSYTGSATFTVKARRSVTVSVSFLPTLAQAYNGALSFAASSGDTLSVSLSGSGSDSGSSDTTQPADPQITLTIDPVSTSLDPGAKQTFIATTHGGDNTGITWKASCGSFSSDGWYGFYTAPSTAGSCTITGYLTADPTVRASALVTVTSSATAMPTITSQPVSCAVTAGQTASFMVSVTGTAPFSYQWKKNGVAMSGATSSSYTTPATTTADNGAQFTVVVSNAAGNVSSNAATLTVNAGTLLLSVSPSSLSFGDVNVSGSASQQATLANTGTSDITLSGLLLSGAGFSANGVSSGQVLTPGQTATIQVSFQPQATGSITGSVTVSSNASPVVVTLSGSGVQQVSHSVSLSWTRSTSTVAGYLVYSSEVSGGPYTKLTTSAVSLPSYTDSSVQNGNTYYYVVTAVDASGTESAFSNQASAVIQ